MTDKPNENEEQVEPQKWSLDVVKRQFISGNGYRLQLQPVSWLMAEQIRHNPATKPKIPKVRVVYGDGVSGEESNPNDPAYQEDLDLWKKDCELKAMVYTFANGLVIDVPESFKISHHKYFPQSDEDVAKYFYIATLIAPEDFGGLVTSILGLSGPTEDGVNQAVAKFRSPE